MFYSNYAKIRHLFRLAARPTVKKTLFMYAVLSVCIFFSTFVAKFLNKV